MTAILDAGPFTAAILQALRDQLPDTYTVGDAEGPKVTPAVALYVTPGLPGGWPFAPGSSASGTFVLHGIGETREQAQRAAQRASQIVVGDITVDGLTVSIVPDDAPPPIPARDDSLTPPLFVQAAVFDFSLS